MATAEILETVQSLEEDLSLLAERTSMTPSAVLRQAVENMQEKCFIDKVNKVAEDAYASGMRTFTSHEERLTEIKEKVKARNPDLAL